MKKPHRRKARHIKGKLRHPRKRKPSNNFLAAKSINKLELVPELQALVRVRR